MAFFLSSSALSFDVRLTGAPGKHSHSPVFACRMRAVASAKVAITDAELPEDVERVSSVANPYVKHLVKIRDVASYRAATKSTLVVGSTLLREVCEFTVTNSSTPFEIEVLLILEGSEPPSDLTPFARRTVQISPHVMEKLSGVKSAEGVDAIGVLPVPSTYCALSSGKNLASVVSTLEGVLSSSPHRLLILDGIQDPGNLGTLLRTAVGFAWNGVFLLPGCCDPFNDKTLRASRAANFKVPIATGTWEQLHAFVRAKDMELYAGSPERVHAGKVSNPAEAVLAKVKCEEPLCLVLGSEGQGLSDVARKSCRPLSVPMPGHLESLNVAVVGGVLMFLLMQKNVQMSGQLKTKLRQSLERLKFKQTMEKVEKEADRPEPSLTERLKKPRKQVVKKDEIASGFRRKQEFGELDVKQKFKAGPKRSGDGERRLFKRSVKQVAREFQEADQVKPKRGTKRP